jgi:hypothetical protein
VRSCSFGSKAQVKSHGILEIPEAYYDDLNLRWEAKFFEGPSIGAVKDSTGDAYHVIVENVTREGFTYYRDHPILTPKDFRKGKWAQVFKRWKAERGIAN